MKQKLRENSREVTGTEINRLSQEHLFPRTVERGGQFFTRNMDSLHSLAYLFIIYFVEMMEKATDECQME